MLKERVLTATEFKAKCLNILDRLEPGGVVITKRGHAVARVIPMNAGTNER
jgi:prevent-host-death family protein